MGKVCISCGAAPASTKPDEEKEDCPGCGGKETVSSEDQSSKE